ncbi:MAG: ArsA family ATPase [Lachnospiraceae bacterium]|nr:ArsA family ATPase [Lachnospiraceae bacterium]
MQKIYIFTGKGGVGKSSIAAAHALKSAQDGKRTLLMSTDMAHNLGDIFERKLGKEAENVLPNLDIYEIDPEYVMRNEFSFIMEYLDKLLSGKGRTEMGRGGQEETERNDIMASVTEGGSLQEMGMLPGMEELFSLLKIAEIYRSERYDRLIVDCAPTGETMSLLKFPELLSWYMEKLFPIGKVGVKVLAPVSKAVFRVEMPNRNAMNDIEKMYLKLSELQELLKDRDTTCVRIVTTPEKMVVEETKRNYMYMNLYNFNVDGIYINRILPQEIGNDFFYQWLAIQRDYITQIKECFGALPIYEIPWYDEELKGERAVRRIVEDVLERADVFASGAITEREKFIQTENGYQLEVFLPYASKEDIDLYQSATDLIIKTDNFKRNIPLPNILRSYMVEGARFEEEKLRIHFMQDETA